MSYQAGCELSLLYMGHISKDRKAEVSAVRPRKMTREDIAFILELKSSGVKLNFIARYVYGIGYSTLRHHLKIWGAV